MGNNFKRIVLLTFIIPFWTVSLVAQSKRALVIGLGQQEDVAWGKINGDKDVPYVIDMLTKSEYQDIHVLKNKQATKIGILLAFEGLTKRCLRGDIIYVHFSGHGQLMTDVSGDEEDGLDEAWIPYDAYRTYSEEYKGEKHLVDDEVNSLLTKIRERIGDEGRLLVVVDACHSGDSSRGGNEIVRGADEDFVIPIKKRPKTKKLIESWLTLSACQDFQINQEMRNPQVGKLTYALYKTVEKGETSFGKIERFMEQYRVSLPQNPMLTGETDKYNLSDFF